MGRGIIAIEAAPCGLVAIRYEDFEVEKPTRMTHAEESIMITAQHAWNIGHAATTLVKDHDLQGFLESAPWARSGVQVNGEQSSGNPATEEFGIMLRPTARERDLIVQHLDPSTPPVLWVGTRPTTVLILAMPVDLKREETREVSIPLSADSTVALGEKFAVAALKSERMGIDAGFPGSWEEAVNEIFASSEDEDL